MSPTQVRAKGKQYASRDYDPLTWKSDVDEALREACFEANLVTSAGKIDRGAVRQAICTMLVDEAQVEEYDDAPSVAKDKRATSKVLFPEFDFDWTTPFELAVVKAVDHVGWIETTPSYTKPLAKMLADDHGLLLCRPTFDKAVGQVIYVTSNEALIERDFWAGHEQKAERLGKQMGGDAAMIATVRPELQAKYAKHLAKAETILGEAARSEMAELVAGKSQDD